MKILLKCPTRSRPNKVYNTLMKYAQLASRPEEIGVAVSCDRTDSSMTDQRAQNSLNMVLSKFAWHHIYFSDNHSKIEACNANMNEIDYPWDIVVLVSDDMIPQIQGYDDVIRRTMRTSFPDTDGILWFNDGAQNEKLNTLSIYGRKMYESLGCMYQPSYKSFFCDTELSDLCRTTLKSKTSYNPTVIIRHEHPATGFKDQNDDLYRSNNRFFAEDLYTYIRRKAYDYDVSFLIPTIVGRELSLNTLVTSIREKMARIAPEMRYELCIEKDNRQMSIGAKRQKLLKNAKGKYTAFIDDDDDITDAYIEDLQETFRGSYHVMRLVGQMGVHPFMHSTEFNLTTMMVGEEPPLFQRPPNHLNPILRDIASFVPFKDATYGEDIEWTIGLAKSGFIGSQYSSDRSRTHYIYNVKNRHVPAETIAFQRRSTLERMLPYLFTSTTQQPKPVQQTKLRLGSRGFVST